MGSEGLGHQSMKRYRGFTEVGRRWGIRGVVKIPDGGLLANKQMSSEGFYVLGG
jgi:hypothetical protein